ncbi:MAG: MFS transporter [Spirochaetales bacterium]|nr:MFS transporter [Spirochaetales bacterium]
MRSPGLTPGELGRARRVFVLFAILNVMAFTLLSGNLVSLFALKLGAGNFMIGLLSSFIYAAYLFMFPGRLLAARWGMVRLMGRFWTARYLCMLPVLLAPLFVTRGFQAVAFGLLVVSVLGFNLTRGVAMAGYNPILGTVAGGKDRGAFLARLQSVQHTVNVGLGVLMAMVLGRDAPLLRYALFIAAGVALGLTGATLVFRFPEPEKAAQAASHTLWRGFAAAFRQRPFRRFIVLFFFSNLIIFMVTPFLVVYFKRLYQQPDNVLLFFTVFGSAGAVLMALISGLVIDRLGAKPLYILFAGILILVVVPMAVSPPLSSQLGVWAFAAAVFFFHSMGQHGIFNAGQTYLLSAIKPEERLNLGLVFYLALGGAGAGGSLLGGAALEWLDSLPGLGEAAAFRIYFGALAAGLLVLLVLLGGLKNLGAVPTLDALAAIFSPRDLRAISLLKRLDKTRTMAEEKDTIRALADSHSELPLQDIVSHLRSPRFTIRAEALQALEQLPLDAQAVQVLMSEVKNHPYTTAHVAAGILGRRGIAEAAPVLRRALRSQDFFLAGASMISLAQLGDRGSVPTICELIRDTANPRLLIHGASALEILHEPSGVPLLLRRLSGKSQPYVRDEIILSVAGILGMGEWFYPKYSAYLERASVGISLLQDTVSASVAPRIPKELLDELLNRLPHRNRKLYAALAAELLETSPIQAAGAEVAPYLGEAVLDPKLMQLERLLFLVAGAIVWNACLETPA